MPPLGVLCRLQSRTASMQVKFLAFTVFKFCILAIRISQYDGVAAKANGSPKFVWKHACFSCTVMLTFFLPLFLA